MAAIQPAPQAPIAAVVNANPQTADAPVIIPQATDAHTATPFLAGLMPVPPSTSVARADDMEVLPARAVEPAVGIAVRAFEMGRGAELASCCAGREPWQQPLNPVRP